MCFTHMVFLSGRTNLPPLDREGDAQFWAKFIQSTLFWIVLKGDNKYFILNVVDDNITFFTQDNQFVFSFSKDLSTRFMLYC